MNNQKEKTITWILKFASKCKGKMIASVVLAILGSICSIVPYLSVGQIVIKICQKNYNYEYIFMWSVIALIGYILGVWLSTYSTMLSHKSAFTILQSIRQRLALKLSNFPMGEIVSIPSGKLKSLIVDTVERLELPLAHMIPELTANILIPLLMLIYMFLLDFRMALISLITIPVGLVCYMGMMKDYEKRYKTVLNAEKNMNASIVEYIGGIEVVKAFNQGTQSYQKFSDAVNENEKVKCRWFKQTNPYYVAGIVIMPSCLIGVLPLGSYLFMNGTLDASALIICTILSLGLVNPLIQALQYTDSLAMVDSTVKEIMGMLNKQELKRPAENTKLNSSNLVFQNVSFGYRDKEVLHNISFHAVDNGITAIVGPSGSGKSTIARLIASFWDIDKGEIMLGGVPMSQLSLETVMNAVAYVSQDNYLFNLSIKENIRLGKEDASDEEVIQAAKKASCHNFIMSLPNGYDTQVGDGGGNLSGGEKQRIAIARAILKNSPIIVLDEATAFTDPENEAIIQKSINELIKRKTLIVIAHRLSTITSADKIIVINEGKIEAEGTHNELVENCRLYKTLWEAHIAAKDTNEEVSKQC